MAEIAESELILNPRGAVYHLDILPEELAHTVILVGDPGRVVMVSKYFDSIETKNAHREFISATGYIGEKRVTVLSTGIGPDNIDIVLNELDALVNIDFKTREIKPFITKLTIIRIGTTGSLQKEIPVDSFVAGSHGIGLDNLLHYYSHTNSPEDELLLSHFINHIELGSKMPYIASASHELLKVYHAGFSQGITITTPGFYGPQGRVLRMSLQYPKLIDSLTSFNYHNLRITNFEMETSAIYGLGKLLGHECLSLNCVVANRVEKQFSKNPSIAIDRLIALTLENLLTL